MFDFGDLDELTGRALEHLAPPPDLTVSQWSDHYRRLSSEASASPGQWRTDVVEYMREIMDCVGDPSVRRLTLMACAQIAKTEMLLNVSGYCIDYDPSPIMVVQPTLDMAKTFSKDRLSPMLRDTPALRGKVQDVKSRDSGNTILQKIFMGGHITMVGANSPSSLASRPIRVVLCDEVDRFPDSAGTEGDPIQLAVKRTATFWNRILIFVSTPTVKGQSRIEDEFEMGDQRRYHCPCPHCGESQVLKWSGVQWDKDKPDTAVYVCEHNGCVISDNQRIAMVRKGKWVAEAEFTGNASFHVTGMMSPFVPLSDGVREFLAAKKNPEKMKVWVNTYLGETWEEDGQRLEYSDLMEQREEYATEVPEEVTLLTAAVDIQDDRFEIEVLGWGDDHETWSINYDIMYGDPSTPEMWNRLEAYLKRTYEHPLFGSMAIRATCVDTGGHYTQGAYIFTKRMQRVFAIKGVGGDGRPMVGKPSRNNIEKIQLFPLGTNAIKEIVVARLKVREPGFAGYCHFPETDAYDENFFKGMTAEKLVTRFHRGFKKQEWSKIRPRNEPFDLRVYNTAALEIIGVNLNAQRKALLLQMERDAKPTQSDALPEQPYRPEQRGNRKRNWASGWKND